MLLFCMILRINTFKFCEKYVFRSFLSQVKRYKGCPVTGRCHCNHCFFHPQKRVPVFWNFNFEPGFFQKSTSCPLNQAHFLTCSDKSLLSPKQNKLKKNLRHGFVDKMQLKTIISK